MGKHLVGNSDRMINILPYGLLHKAYALIYVVDAKEIEQCYKEFVEELELVNISEEEKTKLKNLAEIVMEYRTGRRKGALEKTATALFIHNVLDVFEKIICSEECVYVVGWSEYEWNEEYWLVNPNCPSEEEFKRDVREAIREVVEDMLGGRLKNEGGAPYTETFIGLDDIYKHLLPRLEEKGYKRLKPKAVFKLWSPAYTVFECMEDEDNVKLLGRELCQRIHDHNKKMFKSILAKHNN